MALHLFKEATDDRVGRHARGLGVERRRDAVAHHRKRHRLHVRRDHVGTPQENRPRLGGEDQRKTRARTRAPRDHLPDEVGRRGILRTRRAHEVRRILEHVVRRRHAADDLLQLHHLGRVEDLLELRLRRARDAAVDAHLVRPGRIADRDVEEEAVELRLGQRIRPLLLDRILRRQHEERLGQGTRLAAHGDAVLLHRLEERGLRLRRRAVDLVRQQQVREDRPAHEAERVRPGRLVLVQHLGARHVRRHQVGRELDAAEVEVQHLRKRLDEQGLRQARDAHEERVAAREDRDQRLLDHVLLPDDHLRELALERRILHVELLDERNVVVLHLFNRHFRVSFSESGSTVSSRW